MPLNFFDCVLLFHTVFIPRARRAGFPSWSQSGWNLEFHNNCRYDYDSVDMDQLSAKAIWHRHRYRGANGKSDPLPMFYPITQSEIPGAQELLTEKCVSGSRISPFRRGSGLDLNKMVLFEVEVEVLEIPEARQGLKSQYAMYDGALEFWYEADSVVSKQAPGDKYVMLDEARRKG
jgi:hypothetical protein